MNPLANILAADESLAGRAPQAASPDPFAGVPLTMREALAEQQAAEAAEQRAARNADIDAMLDADLNRQSWPGTWPPPAPCAACGNPIFWLDAYDRLHCGHCEPPPVAALARLWLVATCEHRIGNRKMLPKWERATN